MEKMTEERKKHQLTEDILQFWNETNAFAVSMQSKSERLNYTFYDGPPFTSGDPHYGHLLQSIIKDMIPRWMTMRGYRVARKWGWDCHGIPAENFVNKELGITSRKQVEEEFGIQNYIEACRSMVNNVNDNWKWTIDHIGRWVDMENAYFTMSNDFMESVICVFSDLYHRNLIYKGFKVLGYSRALGTALSNSEIAEGYEMRQDPAVTVKLPLKNVSVDPLPSPIPSRGTEVPKGEGDQIVIDVGDHAIEVVAGVVRDATGRMLMIYENRHSIWFCPGGKIETGELPADALKREVREELGVEVTHEKFLGRVKTVHKGKIFRMHYFEITIAGTPTVQEPDKHGKIARVEKISAENTFGYVLKADDLVITDEQQLRHEFRSFHFIEQGLFAHRETGEAPICLLPWTTTPWTLPANMFAAVHNDIRYVELYDITEKCYFILAEACIEKYYKSPDQYIHVLTLSGRELVGLGYTPLFPYYQNNPTIADTYKAQVHRVLHADFVTTESGTGVVHEAPAFGVDDYDLICTIFPRAHAQDRLFDPVNAYGEFTDLVPDFVGQNVIEANTPIIKNLKERGLLVKQETISHSYPHCPRTATPLIYKAIESWFVKEDQLKAETVPGAEQIHFVPETVKQRFINGLETAPDRNISRTRFWGCPLPVWECSTCDTTVVCGSIAEIEQRSGKTVTDLHRPYIDEITFPCACGATMHRIPEVLDCRFESGSMPYGQDHWMKPADTEATFPNCADFIAEGLDQTRGRFRALHVLGHAYHGQNVFRNVAVTGMILAEDGKKMSKRLKNYPDPSYLLNQYGADPLRLYLLSSPVVRAEPLRFSEKAVEQMLKDVIIPLQNVSNFLQMYAEVDQWKHPGTQVRFMRHAIKQKMNIVGETDTGWITAEGETIEDIDLPLAAEGFAQLTSPEFIEQVVRINPDIIVCSEFLRAQQTAEGAQKVLRDYLGKDIEIVATTDRGLGVKREDRGNEYNTFVATEHTTTAKPISQVYAELLEKYPGKRVLVVSHKRRFRYLWQRLCNLREDINISEAGRQYFIESAECVPLPLTPLHNELDQWIFAELHQTIVATDTLCKAYNVESATKTLLTFVDKLTNRWVRRSRRRFWAPGMEADKHQAYTTLYCVLHIYLRAMAPIMPFTTESIWQTLASLTTVPLGTHPSIHTDSWPLGHSIFINKQLIDEVQQVREIITGALYLRAKQQIKIKQPLQSLSVRLLKS